MEMSLAGWAEAVVLAMGSVILLNQMKDERRRLKRNSFLKERCQIDVTCVSDCYEALYNVNFLSRVI